MRFWSFINTLFVKSLKKLTANQALRTADTKPETFIAAAAATKASRTSSYEVVYLR